MARKKQTATKRNTKTKKHPKKSVRKQSSILAEVEPGLIVLFGIVAASAWVAFVPLMFNV